MREVTNIPAPDFSDKNSHRSSEMWFLGEGHKDRTVGGSGLLMALGEVKLKVGVQNRGQQVYGSKGADWQRRSYI